MDMRAKEITKATKQVMVAPNVYAKTPDKIPASTKLGVLAQQLATQTAITTLSVAATSGYVFALTQASSPNIQFQDVPPGMPSSSLQELQTAYTIFLQQFSVFQGNAGAWINTQQGTGAASIFSQLVSLPTTLSDINGTVTSNFTLLNSLTPGTDAYNKLLKKQEAIVGAESASVSQLNTAMKTLGTHLEEASTALVSSTKSGVLSQLTAAYGADISTLSNAISNATQQISSDNSKIIGEGFGAGASIAVGVVGMLNFWNPAGWIMMGAGAVGAYYAITEIEALKAEIAELKSQIQTDTYYENQDQAAASVLAAFSNQLQGFSAMNQSAQQELTALENLYTTLSDDIATAVADLNSNELAAAQNEWNTILSESAFLANVGAYLWPAPALLSAPSMFAAIGNDIYSIAISGEMYHYSGSSNTWTDMNVTGLSCVGTGSTLIAIEGSPIDGSATGSPSGSTYLVTSYNISTQTWTPISTFPAACIAVGGNAIYAINQLVNDRKVYQYSGTSTTWTALPVLPGPDAAMQIAVAGGAVFALACNSQFVYQYNATNQTWTQVGSFTCTAIVGGGDYLTLIATNNNQYLYSTETGGTPTYTGHHVVQAAQFTNGDQYGINTWQDLWLAANTNPIKYTSLASNATAVFSSDTDLAYYADNMGNLYSVTSAGVKIKLPEFPSA